MTSATLVWPRVMLSVALWSGGAGAAAACEASFPAAVEVAGRPLALNGQGWRIVSPLGIRAYAAALYQPTRTTDATVVLGLGRVWALEMVYCRSASAADIHDAWRKALRRNCREGCVVNEATERDFFALVADARPQARWRLAFDGARIAVYEGATVRGSVADATFAQTLLATWIGVAPATSDLKKALLGQQ